MPAATKRSSEKRAVILEAAELLFFEKGYAGCSVDEVAARAAVSKPTVYKHFGDKAGLFSELVTERVQAASDRVRETVVALSGTGDLEAELRSVATGQLTLVMRPEILRLRRLVIGEAARFPRLGRLFHEGGPGRTVDVLAAGFARLAEAGVLSIDDPRLAAAQFNWLVMGQPLNDAMLLGDDAVFTAADIDRHAAGAVRTFLAAHAPTAVRR